MDGHIYYIYVLKLKNNGFYVGSTRNLLQRIKKHFSIGGAIATKESKPIKIIEILKIQDYKMEIEYAHLVLEIGTAIRYSDDYGENMVRGAKHGKGWNDIPSPYSIKIIKQVRRYMNTGSYKAMLKQIETFDSFKDSLLEDSQRFIEERMFNKLTDISLPKV